MSRNPTDGDQSTFGGGGESSLSDIGGLTGDADLDMEIVDLSRYEVQETLGKGGMGEVLLAGELPVPAALIAAEVVDA